MPSFLARFLYALQGICQANYITICDTSYAGGRGSVCFVIGLGHSITNRTTQPYHASSIAWLDCVVRFNVCCRDNLSLFMILGSLTQQVINPAIF
jgi:hypothetical protein